MTSCSALRLDRLDYPVRTLGPGRRAAIWTAGCDKRCPGCISPSLLQRDAGAWVDVGRLADHIIALKPSPMGLTVSGGEPFLQASALVDLCRLIEERTHLDVLVYSGYSIAELQAHPERGRLLECIDMLIDGEYQRDNPTTRLWCGSANQEFHLLSDRAREKYGTTLAIPDDDSPGLNLAVGNDETVYMSGIPRPGHLKELRRMAAERGVRWRYE